jgi:5-methylcytosine-specific restriction endonuclease McrA
VGGYSGSCIPQPQVVQETEQTMPLPAIPRDPEPTEAQCREYLDRYPATWPESQRHSFASFFWKCDAKKRDPDLFLVAFAGWLPDGYYEAYRKTSTWRAIRKRALAAADYECACCPSRATEVHHRDYRPRVLSGDEISPLVAICRKCHDRIEEAKKVSWNKAEALLACMVAEKEAQMSCRQ